MPEHRPLHRRDGEPTTGVVVVDHGSRRAESNRMLEQLVARFADRSPYPIVEPAHMELAEPSIATAFDRCVARGARRVVVLPYFLLPGRHWTDDIPELTRRAARRHPGVAYLVAAPIGLHPLMLEVLAARLQHCLAHAAGEAPECESCAGTGRCTLRVEGEA
ncbi:MAG: cobalamin biosynthesis protein CbiX [Acidobacteria bacterium]|nr:MAG: cobalamin biosynthesis protein CbiX [Acidobacteriota bacterium]